MCYGGHLSIHVDWRLFNQTGGSENDNFPLSQSAVHAIKMNLEEIKQAAVAVAVAEVVTSG